MANISELGPGAYPRGPYGNFALKRPPQVSGPGPKLGGANLPTRLLARLDLDVFGVLRPSDDTELQ